MNTFQLCKQKALKNINSAFTACGFAVAHYLYIASYNLFLFFKNDNIGPIGLLYVVLAALFIWFLKRVKQNISFSKIFVILLVYFGERTMTLTEFLIEKDYSALIIHLIICTPIIIFLIKGTKSAVNLNSINYANQQNSKKKKVISK